MRKILHEAFIALAGLAWCVGWVAVLLMLVRRSGAGALAWGLMVFAVDVVMMGRGRWKE